MHRNGHYGVALLVYAPVGAVALALGSPSLAVVGCAVAISGALVPDVDQLLPLVAHRGVTHTVWFAFLAGAALGGLGFLVGSTRGPLAGTTLAAFGAVVGVVTIGAHLLADALTPMGVRPFWPLSDAEYALGLATADSRLANYGLLAVGAFATGLAVLGADAVGDLLG